MDGDSSGYVQLKGESSIQMTTKEKNALKARLWRAKNPEKYRAILNRSLVKNRDKRLARRRELYKANPAKDRERCKAWEKKNPDYNAAKHREYRKRFPERYREYERRKVRNPVRRRETLRAWCAFKRATDPNWRLRQNLRTRLYLALKGISKSAPTLRLIGCTIENLWIYLESMFEEGMTRENYGKVWEVDHIIACALFDLTKEDHQKRCFHFSNLQPLFLADNRSKGAKSETTIERRG